MIGCQSKKLQGLGVLLFPLRLGADQKIIVYVIADVACHEDATMPACASCEKRKKEQEQLWIVWIFDGDW